MPNVGGKKYPYTAKGKAAAARDRKRRESRSGAVLRKGGSVDKANRMPAGKKRVVSRKPKRAR